MLYYKIINGRQVFSECKSIQLENGRWVSNPSAEQIASAGWLEYIPPEVVSAPETEPTYDDLLGAIKKMLQGSAEQLSDEDALAVAAIYPTWVSRIGTQVNTGERLWYDTKLYKCVQQHTAQMEWTPDITPALYTEVSIVEWPEWVQPAGAQDAYMRGDKVTHNGQHYISDVDNNVWEPGVYGWTEVQ